ncbi:centrosomal protein of 44 kDa isoform X3 [Nycticebus coucang]|nr:centrosomal protein of 44 kDa isoform X3 [Nycticebus coucang]
MESNIELIAKNDLRFIDAVYKLLRDQFNYKPILTKKQFIQCGFAEWKIQIVCDILNCVIRKHKELSGLDKTSSQQRKKSSSSKSEPLNNEKIPAEAIGVDITGRFLTSGKKKAVVIRHLYNEDSVDRPEDIGISTVTGVSEAVAVSDLKPAEIKIPEVKGPEIKAEQQDIKVSPEIIILQTMLAECQEKLKKLTWIEKRLEYLEENMKGKVMVNEKTWTHLLSRITLLETEMLLSKKIHLLQSYCGSHRNIYQISHCFIKSKKFPPTSGFQFWTDGCIEFNEMSEDYTSCSDMDLPNLDRKIKGERPVSIPLSSGYSSVSTDSTPRASTIHYCLNEISQETTIQKMERMKKMFEETAELLKCPNH